MSAPAQSEPPFDVSPTFSEYWARFRRWCAEHPLQAGLLVGIILTIVWYFVGYKPFIKGTQSIYKWGWEAWDSDNDLEHGSLILPGAIIVAWMHRGDYARAEKRGSWLGLLPLVFGCFLFVAAVWTQQARIALGAFPFLIIGIVWTLWGWAATRITLFPAFLLFFMVPIGFLLSSTEPLQRLISSTVTSISNLVGIGLARDGTRLFSTDGKFSCEVAGGCSGVRSLMAMTMLSLLYGHFTIKEPWKKLLIVAATLPFAIIGNIFRVFTIVLACKLVSQEFGTGLWHNISGFIITIPIAVGAMILFADFLNRDWSGIKDKILAEDAPAAKPVKPEAAMEPSAPSAPATSPSPISYDY